MIEQNLKEFSVSVYGNSEQYSDTISKRRCRIFYRGGNRNGSYITDEFANKLLQTIPYAPIKGIYDTYEEDYSDHGAKRSQGRIYGVVPENMNFQWEKHMDVDGIEREYACVDVLVYSALYEEAQDIVGNALSMELYEPSIQGEWEIIDGQKWFKFTDAFFLGLQILGTDIEPCFEGAGFFSLQEAYDLFEQVKSKDAQGDKEIMTEVIFNSSNFSDTLSALWKVLNVFSEETNEATINYAVCALEENAAIVYNYSEQKYEKIVYSFDEENGIIVSEEKEDYMIYTQSDMDAFSATIEEKEQTINGLTEDLKQAQLTISTLEEQVLTYEKEKVEIENKKKEEIFSFYENKLSEEIFAEIKEKSNEYSAAALNEKFAAALVATNYTLFEREKKEEVLIPKSEPLSAVDAYLSKYVK